VSSVIRADWIRPGDGQGLLATLTSVSSRESRRSATVGSCLLDRISLSVFPSLLLMASPGKVKCPAGELEMFVGHYTTLRGG